MSSLSAIMALKVRGRHHTDNIGRCDVLFESLRHFGLRPLFSEWLIVIPEAEQQYISKYARAWEDFPIRFVIEEDYPATFKKFSTLHEVRHGHRQQVIELLCAELVQTDFFLLLDPDIFALRPFAYRDLIVDGRAIVEADQRAWHAEWWRDSADLLGVSPNLDRPGMGVTPAILSRDACRGLTRFIAERYQQSWCEVLLSRHMTQWTAATLYQLYLEHIGQFHQYHVVPEELGLTRRLHSPAPFAVRNPGDYERLDVQGLFSAQNPGLFTVVQSNVGVTPQRIARDIAAFLPIKVQKYERESPTVREQAQEFCGAALRRALKFVQQRKRLLQLS